MRIDYHISSAGPTCLLERSDGSSDSSIPVESVIDSAKKNSSRKKSSGHKSESLCKSVSVPTTTNDPRTQNKPCHKKRPKRRDHLAEESFEKIPSSSCWQLPEDRRSSLKQRTKSQVSSEAAPAVRRLSRRLTMGSISSKSQVAQRRGSFVEKPNQSVLPETKSIVKSSKTDIGIRKTVSFNEESNVSYENTVIDEEEVKDLWYDRLHLESFKTELETLVYDITTKLKRRTESWRRTMVRAYEIGCEAESDDCLHDHHDPSYKVIVHILKDLYEETTQLVGIEYYLADEIKCDGNRRRGRVLDLMDKLQDAKERRKALNIPLPLDDFTDSEKLFKESCDASIAARNFAVGLAVARLGVTY